MPAAPARGRARDGLSATAFPSGVRNVPIEVNEAISPIVVWKKEYRQDSGGAGEFRGGLGQIMEVGTLDTAPFAISAYYDRIDHPPRGRDGGQDGAGGRRHAASPGRKLRGMGQQTVPKNESVIISMPGGGGLRQSAQAADRPRLREDVRRASSPADAARLRRGGTTSLGCEAGRRRTRRSTDSRLARQSSAPPRRRIGTRGDIER